MTAAEDLKPICVIYGKSDYLRRKALDRIVKRELAGGDPSLNLTRLDGVGAEVAHVLDDVRTFSMLGDRRVVVVGDADDFVSKNRATLERFTQAPADSGCLILLCSSFDARTRLCKAVKTIGETVECKPLQGRPLITWLVSTATDSYQKRLSPQAAVRLCEHVGTSQEALDAELGKLALYVAQRSEITIEDIDIAVGNYREQTVFAVMDAMAAGDTAVALTEWQQVLTTDRAAPGRAIGGLAWGLRKLLDARRRLDQGTPIQVLARENWTDVNIFKRRMQRATVRRLEDQLADLLSADLESKTGLGTVGSAVEKFIVRHSVAAVA